MESQDIEKEDQGPGSPSWGLQIASLQHNMQTSLPPATQQMPTPPQQNAQPSRQQEPVSQPPPQVMIQAQPPAQASTQQQEPARQARMHPQTQYPAQPQQRVSGWRSLVNLPPDEEEQQSQTSRPSAQNPHLSPAQRLQQQPRIHLQPTNQPVISAHQALYYRQRREMTTHRPMEHHRRYRSPPRRPINPQTESRRLWIVAPQNHPTPPEISPQPSALQRRDSGMTLRQRVEALERGKDDNESDEGDVLDENVMEDLGGGYRVRQAQALADGTLRNVRIQYGRESHSWLCGVCDTMVDSTQESHRATCWVAWGYDVARPSRGGM
ncbi:uncharacterized protein CLAFUR5_20222 [Fulvia fulva]|uniref:uncharacterized protein n=1 Tax=Passalora fulva TaxID=5499 RepID=UPI002852AD8D|nr:uncharacterized protein CLAFUR5_20222 [Fulvia fulva]KAK4622875.1 hypothetical protein CLAFUR0_06676 [Fulvia fulva]WMI38919.1 hypothetical protein CLAFUR5_20222 [Fulvia fulva]